MRLFTGNQTQTTPSLRELVANSTSSKQQLSTKPMTIEEAIEICKTNGFRNFSILRVGKNGSLEIEPYTENFQVTGHDEIAVLASDPKGNKITAIALKNGQSSDGLTSTAALPLLVQNDKTTPLLSVRINEKGIFVFNYKGEEASIHPPIITRGQSAVLFEEGAKRLQVERLSRAA